MQELSAVLAAVHTDGQDLLVMASRKLQFIFLFVCNFPVHVAESQHHLLINSTSAKPASHHF